METERKRKAEDQEEPHQEETPSKRPLLESDFALKNDDQVKQEEQQPVEQQSSEEPFYDAIPEAREEQQDNSVSENKEEEEDQKEEAASSGNKDQVEPETKVEPFVDVKAEPAPTAPLETVVPFDRLILIHLEATCDENPTNPAAVQVTKENSEIIELSFVVVNASNLDVLHKQQIFVKPERTPLTAFCSEVTGIKSSMLETAGSLSDAIATLDNYIQHHVEPATFCFVTHGGWPLRIQLPREARDKNIALPSYLSFCRMFDLKQEIQRWQVHHPEVSLRSTSIRDLCEIFDLTRVTDQTVGLNNALTTVEVLRYLLGFRHADVFVHPIDTNADLNQFKKEESQVIHLAGLPFEVTQGELEAWFSSNGLRPTTMWMIQPTDNSKPSISGFVVFQQHDDAMRALALNGRCLGDRPIEVCPSSARVIEAAGNMLVPFPLQAKSRQLRPGDWNCFNCSFHNFASRLYCFKCNAENPNPGPQAGQGPPAQPFSHGDWMCPSCNFHNYSSRMHCKKCAGPKPPRPAIKGPNKKLLSGPPMQQPPPSHPQTYPNMHSGGAPGGPPPPSAGYHGGYNSGTRPHHHISFRPGDWYCPNQTCGFQNFASRNTCFRCHTPNPNQQQQVPNQQQQQQPQHSQYSPHQPSYGYSPEPNSNQSGYNMGYAQGNGGVNGGGGGYGYNHAGGGYGGQSSGGYAPPGGGYSGGGNSGGYSYGGGHPPSGSGYAYGGVHQGGPPGGSGPHNTQFRAGDWICPSCNSHNFASRFQCLKCSTAKPYNASGAPPAGYTASTPPMKPGDWMCRNENCSFHNFAKRTQCAKCGMANPNTQQHEGTGIGGGYGGN
ncbi:hypothetical protein V8B55DRAFT_1448050 [Mucor lusitanicus]